jgi:hypothetical protein
VSFVSRALLFPPVLTIVMDTKHENLEFNVIYDHYYKFSIDAEIVVCTGRAI